MNTAISKIDSENHLVSHLISDEANSGIPVSETVKALVNSEMDEGVLDLIDYQVLVGSGSAVMLGLIPENAKVISSLNIVTAVGTLGKDEVNPLVLRRVIQYSSQNFEGFRISPDFRHVFAVQNLPPDVEEDPFFQISNLSHILSWARPYVIKISKHFEYTILRPACSKCISRDAMDDLTPDYLISLAQIGLEAWESTFLHLDAKRSKELVDRVTQYKASWYQGKSDEKEMEIKTNSSLPREIKNIVLEYL